MAMLDKYTLNHTESSSEKNFSESQKEALREALRWYRKDSLQSKKISWAAIADSINEAQGCSINPKYLAKFVDGIPKIDPKTKKKIGRIYQSSLPDNGLQHIAMFLSDPHEAENIFNFKSFEDEGAYFPWPPSLRDYLTTTSHNCLVPDYSLFHGAYRLFWNDDAMTLYLSPTEFHNILRFKIFYGSIDIDAIYLPVYKVSGWAIPTTSDNLLFFGRDLRKNNEAVCFTTLAFDNRLRQGEPPQRFLLKKNTLPIDTETLSNEDDIPKQLLKSIQEDSHAIWDARLVKSFKSNNNSNV